MSNSKDVLKGTGFSPSVEPAQSQGAGSLGLQPEVSPGEELAPEDSYMEGPYLVFTAAYHLRRGYCCNSDCRHCPYK
jgi:hypothetical protein